MLALLDEDVDFGELLHTQLPLQLRLNAQSNVQGEATGRGRRNPSDSVVNLLVFFVHSDDDKVLINDTKLL